MVAEARSAFLNLDLSASLLGMRKVYIDAYGVAGTGTPLYQSGVSVQTGPHQHNRISVTSNNVDLEGKYFHSPNR